jgi:hypothetical protein
MLHRPAHRSPASARKAGYRRRLRDGCMVVPIEIDGELIDWLIAVRWLEPAKADDRREIGAAIRRMLADAARG